MATHVIPHRVAQLCLTHGLARDGHAMSVLVVFIVYSWGGRNPLKPDSGIVYELRPLLGISIARNTVFAKSI